MLTDSNAVCSHTGKFVWKKKAFLSALRLSHAITSRRVHLRRPERRAVLRSGRVCVRGRSPLLPRARLPRLRLCAGWFPSLQCVVLHQDTCFLGATAAADSTGYDTRLNDAKQHRYSVGTPWL